MSDRDPSSDRRYDPRFVAPQHRPKPSGRALYPSAKRREAAERQDAERAGLEELNPDAVRDLLSRIEQRHQRAIRGE